LFKPDEKNIEQIIDAVEKLGPLGLTVKSDELRSIIGMSNPDEGDEVVGGRAPQEPPPAFDGLDAGRNVALNASGADPADGVDGLDAENGSGYAAISDEIAGVIEKAADAATDFASFHKELEKLVAGWAPDKIAECIAVAMFKARALGDAEATGKNNARHNT